MSDLDKAIDTLAEFLPHLRIAINAAKDSGCVVEIGILSTKPDGSGRIVARFNPGFVDDLSTVIHSFPKHDLSPWKLSVPNGEEG